MKKLLLNVVAIVALSASLVSCNGGGGGYYYQATNHYNCYPVYDYWGYYMYDECYWEYYSTTGEKISSELDIVSEVSDIEALKLERMSVHYAEKFELSQDQALKVAKNVRDFSALEDRSESDIADFAQKLYGVNPTAVVSAIGKAQVGQNAELESLIDSAAANFNTSKENTKALIKELHGNALEANGINL